MVGLTIVLLVVFFCSEFQFVVEPTFLFHHSNRKLIDMFSVLTGSALNSYV